MVVLEILRPITIEDNMEVAMKIRILSHLFTCMLFTCYLIMPVTAQGMDLSGEWTGDWGHVVIEENKGTYTDTYGTGQGRFKFQLYSDGTYFGVWGESTRRHGAMIFTVTEDGRKITGSWMGSEFSPIAPGNSGGINWRKI